MKTVKEDRYSFSNHLGLRMESRKNKRKQEKLLKKQRAGKRQNLEKIVELTNVNQKKGKKMGNKSENKNKPLLKQGAQRIMKKNKITLNDSEGFQITASNSERMMKLQEFVNQETGKMSNRNKKEKNKKNTLIMPESSQKSNLIKDKKKLESIRKDQEEDTHEINKLGKLLHWNKTQKHKISSKFGDDFGDVFSHILADIEEGTMKRASGYNDKKVSNLFKESSDSESENSHMNSKIENDDAKSWISKPNGKSTLQIRKKIVEKNYQTLCNTSVEDASEDQLSSDSRVSDEGTAENEDDEDFINSDEEDFSDKDSSTALTFLDRYAEECSEDESSDEKPVHDETKEYQLAFEGGSNYYEKPDTIIDNGADCYWSDSDDNRDLDDFIVDDDQVEYETTDSADNEKLSSHQMKNVRKRRRLITLDDDDDESNNEEIENFSTDGVPDIEVKLRDKSKNYRKRITSESDYSSPEKKYSKKKISAISDDENSDLQVIDHKKLKTKKTLKNNISNLTSQGGSNGSVETVADEAPQNNPSTDGVWRKCKKSKKKQTTEDGKEGNDMFVENVDDEPPIVKQKKKKKLKKLNQSSDCDEVKDKPASSHLMAQDVANDVSEDIYGRLRDNQGNIVEEVTQAHNGRYIPPALRKLMAMGIDEKKREELLRLKKTMKGLLNRLAESNLAGISSQIEGMYLRHSHNDVNECLSQLYMESIVAPSLTPERLVQEHALLVAVLSANVGNQVGAHLLTEFVLKLCDEMETKSSNEDVGCKKQDNILLLIANLFNFRVMNAKLVYDILQRLADKFTEKEVDLILLILRTVGFPLRKEDPMALKTFITQIQAQAANHQSKSSANYTRICFMLEVIHSIKNNNPAKVPNYDPTHVQYLKKLTKGLFHKGKALTPLNVTLTDILNSKSLGRWWIVGSAWSGGLKENEVASEKTKVAKKKASCMEEQFSERFKKRAAKLHLTRPPRINIMYIITEGSEDYLDAFDKLLQLKLPANQEQEIFNVILLCCQKSKVYNEFFSHLSIRICKFDKRYKRILQFSVWDKFKELENCKPRDTDNLAQFLVHLIKEDALSITVLKTLSFIDVDEALVNFIKTILRGLLLHPSGSERVLQIFGKISAQPELQVFSQSLRIFISKFIISKKKKDKPNSQMLYSRGQEVLELLSTRGGVLL
ncbi:Nucleolar MIF4G domain-containing protein 1 [Halocaridina rubra]|uniref:Nucleolar MIF4G domain-containing protein 1 n=1 Tax=Halocaridina rubra TaxID=373956 RepID=A0AAN9AHK2_HALRR